MPNLSDLLERESRTVDLEPNGFERLIRRRDRKRRNQRIAAGVVGIAVFVAAIWSVTSEGWFDRSEGPAHPIKPPIQEPTESDKGFVGLAPVETEPSLPKVGELLIRFSYACCPMQILNVYRDGRIIWVQYNNVEPDQKGWVDLVPQRANKYETGLLEQRLTPEGVELLRIELIHSGLFDQSRSFKRVEGAGIIDITVWKAPRLSGSGGGPTISRSMPRPNRPARSSD
jgi:hypothetical protein